MTAEQAAALDALAALLGAQALPLFLAALALLLVATAVGWRLLRRRVLPPLREHLPDGVRLTLALGLAFALVLGAGALFAETMEALDAEGALGRFDVALVTAVRADTGNAARAAFAAVTRLGDRPVLWVVAVLVALVLLRLARRRLALAWLLVVAGNGLLNPALKAVFARVRPLHDGVPALEPGYSFPSGHASGALVVYGMLAYVLLRLAPARWHLPLLLAAVATVFTVGCSRVFLSVHYPSDVLAGFASGGAWLAACIASIEVQRRRRRARGG